MFDMMKMMGKFKEAQDKMKEIKNQLDTIKVESESGAGLVKVEVNGKKEAPAAHQTMRPPSRGAREVREPRDSGANT